MPVRAPTVPGGALLRAAHPGPVAAVTALTGLLAVALGLGVGTGLLVTAAVLTGQLTIGWSNDLVDAGRDRAVARARKPVATGEVPEPVVRRAIGVAAVLCVGLSLACGWQAALVHVLLGVGSGWAYNLGFKRTLWSPLPYAVAFGTLPAVVSLASSTRAWPPGWMVATGALLGVGAHLLNTLPDLADDTATGVRSLPQRLGSGPVRVLAPVVLLGGSVVATVGAAGPAPAWAWAGLASSAALAVVAAAGRGRVPFAAAVAIALVDVTVLTLR